MTLWLVRAGAYGEYEKEFLEDNRVYLTRDDLDEDLSKFKDREDLRALLQKTYPNYSVKKIHNITGQIFAFSQRIAINDWVVLPSKLRSAVHFARVISDYIFDDKEAPFPHYRKVEWLVQDVPRSNFDQDLLYSFGAFMTVCEISRNEAEKRVKKMAQNDWKTPRIATKVGKQDELNNDIDENNLLGDLAQAAQDQIAKLIIAKFKGHGMERLVDAVLRAIGYTTYLSPEGADKGIDILAAPEPMGFGEPRVCVQVKSSDSPLDRPTLDQLIGVMQNVQASHGLLVSWSGFKSSIDREAATQFFRVRLWDQGDLIDQVLTHYDKLDEDIKAELPLKRIWVVAEAEE